MRTASALLGIILLAGCGLESQELRKDLEAQVLFSKDDELFMKGHATGLVETYESQIVNAHTGLRLLKDIDIDEVEAYRRMLVNRMNSALLALGYIADEITIRPDVLKILAGMKSANYKVFFERLKEARTHNNWLYEKSEKEEKVQWVLDQYIHYGNILGFQDL